MLKKHPIFNISLLFDKDEIINQLNSKIFQKKGGYICFINANIIVNAYLNLDYNNIIKNSAFNVCDGSIIATLFNKINRTKYASYSGPDLFKDIIHLRKYKSFFLGANEETLIKLINKLKDIDFNIETMSWYCPPFLAAEQFNYEEIANLIKKAQPDIVWVALGAPKQEYFMANLSRYLDNTILLGVGQAFNTTAYSNKAPHLLRKFKLEWLYRLLIEPKKTFRRIIKEIWYLPQIMIKEINSN